MICEKCGEALEIGSWPWCGSAKNTHGKPSRSKGFEAFYDHGLDMVVTGFGDINKACRPQWNNDHVTHIQPRDKSESYYRELNERRRERAESQRRQR